LGQIDVVAENLGAKLKQKKMAGGALVSSIEDFYLTNPIARSSQLMAELSSGVKARAIKAFAAE
jgi:NADH-quinone oxidoreductase subunit G